MPHRLNTAAAPHFPVDAQIDEHSEMITALKGQLLAENFSKKLSF
jgi:hypothetical protein